MVVILPLMSKEHKDNCLKTGIEFNRLMTLIAGDKAAEVIGVGMERGKDNLIVTVTKNAAKEYHNPETDRTLEEILDDLIDCAGVLPVSVTKAEGTYVVIQKTK